MVSIHGLEVAQVEVPLQGVEMSIGTFASLPHLIVRLRTSEGAGCGEATVIPEFMGETLAGVEEDLRRLDRALAGIDAGDLELVHAVVDRTAPGSRSARSAVDQACHDAAAAAQDVPVWSLLGEQLREQVGCTWVIGSSDPEAVAAEGRRRVREGYGTLKLKVGLDDRLDLEALRRLRAAAGPDVAIRLDANGAYAPEAALRALEPMLRFEIELVEQPCAADELAAMRRLRRELGVRVLADESVFSREDAERLIEAEAADLVNVKVQKLGGLRPSLEVARLVEEAGLGCVVGSCLEAGPGAAASAHFAAVCESSRLDSDLSAGLQLGESGSALARRTAAALGGLGVSVKVPEGAGLGIISC